MRTAGSDNRVARPARGQACGAVAGNLSFGFPAKVATAFDPNLPVQLIMSLPRSGTVERPPPLSHLSRLARLRQNAGRRPCLLVRVMLQMRTMNPSWIRAFGCFVIAGGVLAFYTVGCDHREFLPAQQFPTISTHLKKMLAPNAAGMLTGEPGAILNCRRDFSAGGYEWKAEIDGT